MRPYPIIRKASVVTLRKGVESQNSARNCVKQRHGNSSDVRGNMCIINMRQWELGSNVSVTFCPTYLPNLASFTRQMTDSSLPKTDGCPYNVFGSPINKKKISYPTS